MVSDLLQIWSASLSPSVCSLPFGSSKSCMIFLSSDVVLYKHLTIEFITLGDINIIVVIINVINVIISADAAESCEQ